MTLAITTTEQASALAAQLSRSNLLPSALNKNPADILTIILTGQELGLAPMMSLRGIRIIQGQPTLSADTMGALVRSRRDVCGYLRIISSSATEATYETQRAGDPEATRMTYTIGQAKQAGLLGSQAWQRYPDAMLRARCLSAICRAVYPDLILGMYDPDELAPLERAATPPPAAPVDAIRAAVAQTLATPAEPAREEPPPPMEPAPLEVEEAPAPAPVEQHGATVATVPFGKNKGVPVSALTPKQLQWYATAAQEKLDDPSKARWHAETQKWLWAVEAEIARKEEFLLHGG